MARILAIMEEGVDLLTRIYTRDFQSLEPIWRKRGEEDFWGEASDKLGGDVWYLEYKEVRSLRALLKSSSL